MLIEVVAKALNAPLGVDVSLDQVQRFVDLWYVDRSILALQRRVFEDLQGFENSHGVELASQLQFFSLFSGNQLQVIFRSSPDNSRSIDKLFVPDQLHLGPLAFQSAGDMVINPFFCRLKYVILCLIKGGEFTGTIKAN